MGGGGGWEGGLFGLGGERAGGGGTTKDEEGGGRVLGGGMRWGVQESHDVVGMQRIGSGQTDRGRGHESGRQGV